VRTGPDWGSASHSADGVQRRTMAESMPGTSLASDASSRSTSHGSSLLPSRQAHLWSIDPRGDRRQPADSDHASPWLARRRGTSDTHPPRPGSPRSTDEPDDSAQAPTPIRPRDASIDRVPLPTPSCGQPWSYASRTQARHHGHLMQFNRARHAPAGERTRLIPQCRRSPPVSARWSEDGAPACARRPPRRYDNRSNHYEGRTGSAVRRGRVSPIRRAPKTRRALPSRGRHFLPG